MQWNTEVLAAVRARCCPTWDANTDALFADFASHNTGTCGEYPLPRRGGASTLCAAYAAHLCAENPRARVLILTANQDTARVMLEYISRIAVASDRIRVAAAEGYKVRKQETVLVDNYGRVADWPALSATAFGFGVPTTV